MSTGCHPQGDEQAFSHLALINAVMHVINAETGAGNKFTGTDPGAT